MGLTAAERRKIYEKERVRLQAQEQLKRKVSVKRIVLGVVILGGLGVIGSLTGNQGSGSTPQRQEPQEPSGISVTGIAYKGSGAQAFAAYLDVANKTADGRMVNSVLTDSIGLAQVDATNTLCRSMMLDPLSRKQLLSQWHSRFKAIIGRTNDTATLILTCEGAKAAEFGDWHGLKWLL